MLQKFDDLLSLPKGRIPMQNVLIVLSILVQTWRASVSLLSSQSQVMSSPLVIIDDMSPSIQYSGPWFEFNVPATLAQTSDIALGNPFQNTLHGVNVTAILFFPFSGMRHLL